MQNACSLKRWHVMEWGAGSPLTGGAWASAKHRALKSLPTCNRTLPEHVSQIFYPPLLSSAGARPPPCCPCRRGRRAAPGGARGPGRAAQHRATQHARWRACPALLRAASPARTPWGAGAQQTPRSGPPGALRGAAALQALERALAALVGTLGLFHRGLARVRARAAAAAAADSVGVLCVHRVGATGGRQRHWPAQRARSDKPCRALW